MRKHSLLLLSLKVLKLLIVVLLFSCGSESKPAVDKVDTILIDSIQGNAPEDSVIYKNIEEEEEDEENEENSNPMVPEEG